MEKLSLYDLLGKFGNGKSEATAFPHDRPDRASDSPEPVGTPPQYAMNAKMRTFVEKHDAAVREILAASAEKKSAKAPRKRAAKKPAKRKKHCERPAPSTPAPTAPPPAAAEPARKKRGRPKKNA